MSKGSISFDPQVDFGRAIRDRNYCYTLAANLPRRDLARVFEKLQKTYEGSYVGWAGVSNLQILADVVNGETPE